MKILALDPSKRCTGLVLTDSNDPDHISWATFEFERADKKMRKTAEKIAFQRGYTQMLRQVIETHKVDRVVSEFPFGSQSAVAAWYLGMVTQAITSVALCLLEHPAEFVLPGSARKAILGDRNAEKQLGVRFAHDHLTGEGRQAYQKLAAYKKEAVADALVISLYFRNVKYL